MTPRTAAARTISPPTLTATAPLKRGDGEGPQPRRGARRTDSLAALAVGADQQPDAERDGQPDKQGPDRLH